jgi:MFS family permease
MLALVPLFPVALIAFNVIEPPEEAEKGPGAAPAARGQASAIELLRDRPLLRIFGVSALAHTTWSIMHFLVPVYGTQIGLSASAIGMVVGAYSIASVLIRAFMTLLARRFTSWQQMLMALASTGVCFVFFPLFTAVPPLMILAFCVGLGMGLSGPLSQALLYDASPPERVGEVMGLRVMAMNVNQTVVPLAAGAIGAAVGVAPVFWALAVMLMGGAYATRAQWRRAKG